MSKKVRSPEPPAEWSRGIDYRHDLEMARFSRVSYLDETGVRSMDPVINPDYPHLFDGKEGGLRVWEQIKHENRNDTTGFVAYAFVNEEQQRVVIAIRGSDNAPDWSGPNAVVARDGELLDLLDLPAPGSDRTRGQMARVQDALLPGDAWDPQFRQALDFAEAVRARYQPLGYRFEVTGHSMGGTHAQVLSHTFGWEGRSFDAPGAANIVQSKGYRQWLAGQDIAPAGIPRHRPDGAFDSGFLNYNVNNSAVSQKMGPHLGDTQPISSYVGREGVGSHLRYAAGLAGGGISETPLFGPALKAVGAGRLATTAGLAAHGIHHGVDALDRHDMSRIVALFEEAVRRQDRGDRQPLPVLGEQDRRDLPPLARADAGRGALDGSLLHLQQQAPPSLFGVPGHDPMARFADASMSGDPEAFRQAARELCDTPQARAWLQAGQERLLALDTCRTGDQAKQTQDPAIWQHAGINPIEHGLVR